jgi:hypothetical protein
VAHPHGGTRFLTLLSSSVSQLRMARGGSGSRFYSAPTVKSVPAIPGGSTGKETAAAELGGHPASATGFGVCCDTVGRKGLTTRARMVSRSGAQREDWAWVVRLSRRSRLSAPWWELGRAR